MADIVGLDFMPCFISTLSEALSTHRAFVWLLSCEKIKYESRNRRAKKESTCPTVSRYTFYSFNEN